MQNAENSETVPAAKFTSMTMSPERPNKRSFLPRITGAQAQKLVNKYKLGGNDSLRALALSPKDKGSKDELQLISSNKKHLPKISQSKSTRNNARNSMNLRLESLSASEDGEESVNDKAERTKRFKLLSNVIKSNEMSKIFRSRELQRNPKLTGDSYEMGIQKSLLYPRERQSLPEAEIVPMRTDIPRNLEFSNNIGAESTYQVRKQLRKNLFDHKNFDENLDQPALLSFTRQIYNQNEPMSQEILNKHSAEFATDTGVYKDLKARLCDIHNTANEESAKQKKNQGENKAILKKESSQAQVPKHKLLPKGVQLVQATALMQKIKDDIEERKDLPSLNKKKQEDLMQLIKFTGNFKGYHQHMTDQLTQDEIEQLFKKKFESILELDHKESERLKKRLEQISGKKEKVEPSEWVKNRIAAKKQRNNDSKMSKHKDEQPLQVGPSYHDLMDQSSAEESKLHASPKRSPRKRKDDLAPKAIKVPQISQSRQLKSHFLKGNDVVCLDIIKRMKGVDGDKKPSNPKITDQSMRNLQGVVTTSSIDHDVTEMQSNHATIEHMNIIMTNRAGISRDELNETSRIDDDQMLVNQDQLNDDNCMVLQSTTSLDQSVWAKMSDEQQNQIKSQVLKRGVTSNVNVMNSMNLKFTEASSAIDNSVEIYKNGKMYKDGEIFRSQAIHQMKNQQKPRLNFSMEGKDAILKYHRNNTVGNSLNFISARSNAETHIDTSSQAQLKNLMSDCTEFLQRGQPKFHTGPKKLKTSQTVGAASTTTGQSTLPDIEEEKLFAEICKAANQATEEYKKLKENYNLYYDGLMKVKSAAEQQEEDEELEKYLKNKNFKSPYPDMADIKREIRNDEDFNNTYFIGKKNIQEVKKTDPDYGRICFTNQGNKQTFWKPDYKLGNSKIIRFIFEGIEGNN